MNGIMPFSANDNISDINMSSIKGYEQENQYGSYA
jgi:hypothetical protein